MSRKPKEEFWIAMLVMVVLAIGTAFIATRLIDGKDNTLAYFFVFDADTRPGDANSTLKGVDIYVDDKRVLRDVSEMVTISLEPGRHVIRAEAPGYIPQEKVVIAEPDGGEAYPSFSLRRE